MMSSSGGRSKLERAGETLYAYTPHRWPTGWLVLLGSVAPFLIFTGLFALTSFRGHEKGAYVVQLSILAVNLALICAWPQRSGRGLVGRSPMDFVPLASCLLAVMWALLLGPYVNQLQEPYVRAYSYREYMDVSPNSNPMAYTDAGVMHFTSDSKVITDMGAGYKVWPHRYCAAPIARNGSSGDSEGRSSLTDAVGFWAVGLNCCDSRGGFNCDSSTYSNAHSGFVVDSSFLGITAGHEPEEHFHAAVRMSAAVFGIELASEGVTFIRWEEHPRNEASLKGWMALCVFVFFELFAAGCAALLRLLLLTLHRLKK